MVGAVDYTVFPGWPARHADRHSRIVGVVVEEAMDGGLKDGLKLAKRIRQFSK